MSCAVLRRTLTSSRSEGGADVGLERKVRAPEERAKSNTPRTCRRTASSIWAWVAIRRSTSTGPSRRPSRAACSRLGSRSFRDRTPERVHDLSQATREGSEEPLTMCPAMKRRSRLSSSRVKREPTRQPADEEGAQDPYECRLRERPAHQGRCGFQESSLIIVFSPRCSVVQSPCRMEITAVTPSSWAR